MTYWIRLFSDPRLLRRASYCLVGAITAGTILFILGSPYPGYALGAALAVPLFVLGSLPSRQWRPIVLAAGAATVGAFTNGETVALWVSASALVFASIAEDQRETPLVGWIGGLVGAMGSVLLWTTPDLPLFGAVLVGGGAGTLLRVRLNALELTGETRALRGQTAWLEQRTSLARELHDVVGHHVTAMVVQSEAGQVGDPQAALRAIGELGRTALGELDALVVHLRDPNAPLTLSAPPRLLDIDELLAGPLRSQGVQVDVRIDPDLDLDEIGTLTVYRIAQEGLTNITRHAAARHAWVEVRAGADQVRLRISDDGIGPPGAEVRRGSGLLGIAERVHAAGGDWDLGRRPGGGTMLDVLLPTPTGRLR